MTHLTLGICPDKGQAFSKDYISRAEAQADIDFRYALNQISQFEWSRLFDILSKMSYSGQVL